MTNTIDRLSLLAAPLLLLGYGVTRLIDGRDGQYGPGTWWTISHALFLGALVAFGAVVAKLARGTWNLPTRWIGVGTAIVTAAGFVVFVRIVVVDLVVGLRAADAAGMSALFDQYRTAPVPVPEVLNALGPAAFFGGLTILLILLAVAGTVPWWSPVLSVGTALIEVELALIPLAAVLVGVALGPLWWARRPVQPAPNAPAVW